MADTPEIASTRQPKVTRGAPPLHHRVQQRDPHCRRQQHPRPRKPQRHQGQTRRPEHRKDDQERPDQPLPSNVSGPEYDERRIPGKDSPG